MAGKDNPVAQLIARVEELGYLVTITRGGHYKVHTPNGPVFMPCTGNSKGTSWRKDRSRLRRHGVAV